VLKLLPGNVQIAYYDDSAKWASERTSGEIIWASVEYVMRGRLVPTTYVVGRIEHCEDTLK